jgi:hypothetical protein
VELRTAVTSGKRKTNLQDPQEDPRAGIYDEASKQDVQRVTKMRNQTGWRVRPPPKRKKVLQREREREREREVNGTLVGWLETSALKEGARVVERDCSPQLRGKTQQEETSSQREGRR